MTIQEQALHLPKIEQIKLMEALWSNLSRSSEYEVPSWHLQELENTERQIEAGEAKFVDWSEAKRQLRNL